MKKYLALVMAAVISAVCVFPCAGDEIKILANPEIEKLTNEQLVNTYIDAKIEAEAYKAFGRTGYSHKEYSEYRELLAFIVRLRQEMEKRQVDAPPVDEWLK